MFCPHQQTGTLSLWASLWCGLSLSACLCFRLHCGSGRKASLTNSPAFSHLMSVVLLFWSVFFLFFFFLGISQFSNVVPASRQDLVPSIEIHAYFVCAYLCNSIVYLKWTKKTQWLRLLFLLFFLSITLLSIFIFIKKKISLVSEVFSDSSLPADTLLLLWL